MDIVMIIVCVVAAYLLGATPFAYLAGRVLKGIDIRKFGSGNVGATNVLRTLGKAPGIAVLLLDMAKGVLAVTVLPMIAMRFMSPEMPVSPELLKVLCGIAAIAGHIWTVFLRFKGGKGVATTVGVFFGLTWLSMLIAVGVFVLVVYVTRFISVGSIMLGVAIVVSNIVLKQPLEYIVFSAAVAALIVYTHRSNIKRLLSGTENKLGRKAEVKEGKTS